MPLVWHERSFAAVVAGVSIKEQQVLESMPSYEKKESEVIYLESEVSEQESLPLIDDAEETIEDEVMFDEEYEEADVSEDYIEYYEEYENQFAARLSETPRKPRSRMCTTTHRTISSNLRILSSACDTRSVCKVQLNVRTAKPKPPKPVLPLPAGNFKVKSPYASNIVRQNHEPAYEDWCKKMEAYNACLKSRRQFAEKTFEQNVTSIARRDTVSQTAASMPSASPTPRTSNSSASSSSQQQPVSRRFHQLSSHHRFTCERGNDRWAKVLNQRALVKNLIKQRQAVQTRREQCNSSFAKRSSKKVREMCNKAQKAKADQRFMTSELKASQQWLIQYQQLKQHHQQQQQLPSSPVPTTRRQRPLRSICNIARPTLGPRINVVRKSPAPLIEAPKPEPPSPMEEFETYRRAFFERNRMQIERSHHANSGLRPSKVTFAAISPNIAEKFMEKRERLGGIDQGSLLYHGTRPTNIPSILQKGFLIPNKVYADGTSIRVINGSSYGVGIYASHDPSYSTSYTGGDVPIFICAVLKGQPYQPTVFTRNFKPGRYTRVPHWTQPTGGVRTFGNICVIFEESRIVPLFMLHFADRNKPQPKPESTPEQVRPSYKKSSRNWFQEQRKQASRPLKFVPAQKLREILHKNYATIRKNSAAAKQQTQLE